MTRIELADSAVARAGRECLFLVGEEPGGGHREAVGDLPQVLDGDVVLAAFDRAEVGAVESASVCGVFLAEVEALAAVADRLAEADVSRGLRVHRHTVDRCGLEVHGISFPFGRQGGAQRDLKWVLRHNTLRGVDPPLPQRAKRREDGT